MKPSTIYSDTIGQDALDQYEAAMALPCVVQGALMPDCHKGYSLPIGAVVKTKDRVFPAFVGYDIGCGVACLEIGVHYKDVDLEGLKDHILKTIPIGFNKHSAPQHTDELPDMASTTQMLKDVFSLKGLPQLGTLGGGNHFIEVGYLESNQNIAVVIHSGSRGFGHGVANYYMNEAASLSTESEWPRIAQEHMADFNERNAKWRESVTYMGAPSELTDKFIKAQNSYIAKQKAQYMKSQDVEGLHSFDISSQLGQDYINDMNFCLDYALLNRKVMIERITEFILKDVAAVLPLTKQFINRNHNHAELVDGFIIHRKGATHAEEGMMGVIPGNMRDGSFIVKGKGNPDSMCSSSHGAGRVLSRKKAKATLSLQEFQDETSKLVTNHTAAMIDEAPKAYKDIFEVMSLQADLVEVQDRVIPILNIKG